MWAQRKKGFTIVELLIVIVVVAILVAVTVAAFNGIQQRARDSQRLADMKTIRTALELYKSYNGAYPGPTSVNGSWEQSNEDGGSGAFLESLTNTGVINGPAPVDPSNNATAYYSYYRYAAGNYSCDTARGAYYVIGIKDMESSGRPHPSNPGFSCAGRDWATEFDWVVGGYEN